MIIADSGSTKTHWAIIRQGVYIPLTTQGLNPRLVTDEQFGDALRSVSSLLDTETPCTVRFYGAGCGSPDMQRRASTLMRAAFPNARVYVATDLLGACLALARRHKCVVAILGTGSNACCFDGQKILHQVPSTGWILGDEGSGNHIGRRLAKDYLTRRMPPSLAQDFSQLYDISPESLLQNIYSQPLANRYLATFAPFASQNSRHPYIHQTLCELFTQFWSQMVEPLGQPGEVRIAGSVASAFEDVIRETAPEGYYLSKVVKSPIDALVARYTIQPVTQ